jgi:hypothetical protein
VVVEVDEWDGQGSVLVDVVEPDVVVEPEVVEPDVEEEVVCAAAVWAVLRAAW